MVARVLGDTAAVKPACSSCPPCRYFGVAQQHGLHELDRRRYERRLHVHQMFHQSHRALPRDMPLQVCSVLTVAVLPYSS